MPQVASFPPGIVKVGNSSQGNGDKGDDRRILELGGTKENHSNDILGEIGEILQRELQCCSASNPE
jgi:hypothetical protein